MDQIDFCRFVLFCSVNKKQSCCFLIRCYLQLIGCSCAKSSALIVEKEKLGLNWKQSEVVFDVGRNTHSMCVNHCVASNRNCLFIVNRLQIVHFIFFFFFTYSHKDHMTNHTHIECQFVVLVLDLNGR